MKELQELLTFEKTHSKSTQNFNYNTNCDPSLSGLLVKALNPEFLHTFKS